MTLTAKLAYTETSVQFKTVEISQLKVFRPDPLEELSMEAGLFMSLASIQLDKQIKEFKGKTLHIHQQDWLSGFDKNLFEQCLGIYVDFFSVFINPGQVTLNAYYDQAKNDMKNDNHQKCDREQFIESLYSGINKWIGRETYSELSMALRMAIDLQTYFGIEQ